MYGDNRVYAYNEMQELQKFVEDAIKHNKIFANIKIGDIELALAKDGRLISGYITWPAEAPAGALRLPTRICCCGRCSPVLTYIQHGKRYANFAIYANDAELDKAIETIASFFKSVIKSVTTPA